MPLIERQVRAGEVLEVDANSCPRPAQEARDHGNLNGEGERRILRAKANRGVRDRIGEPRGPLAHRQGADRVGLDAAEMAGEHFEAGAQGRRGRHEARNRAQGGQLEFPAQIQTQRAVARFASSRLEHRSEGCKGHHAGRRLQAIPGEARAGGKFRAVRSSPSDRAQKFLRGGHSDRSQWRHRRVPELRCEQAAARCMPCIPRRACISRMISRSWPDVAFCQSAARRSAYALSVMVWIWPMRSPALSATRRSTFDARRSGGPRPPNPPEETI